MSSEERARRRREAREAAGPAVMLWSPTGHVVDTTGRLGRDPKPNIPGGHTWIAMVTFQMTEEAVAASMDAGTRKYLDQENLLDIGIACYVCEEPLGAIQPGSMCPGDPAGQKPAT